MPACSYQVLHTALTSQNGEPSPLEGRVMRGEDVSLGARASRVVIIALPYIGYFLIAAAVMTPIRL